MNELDTKIQKALQAATELSGPITEPSFTDELMATFHGRHSWLMVGGWIKMAVAGLLFYICAYQFFQQETMMAMIAYATTAVICIVTAATIMLFVWIQMNHNTTVREVKKLELQIALMTHELRQQAKKD